VYQNYVNIILVLVEIRVILWLQKGAKQIPFFISNIVIIEILMDNLYLRYWL